MVRQTRTLEANKPVRFVAPKNKEETMKSILMAAVVLFLAATAGAADYVAYKGSGGTIVLSNLPPPASGQVVARHSLPDATEAEIAATEKSNLEIAKINALRDLTESYDRFTEAIIAAYAPQPILLEWNQVAVSVGQPRLRRGFTHVQPMSK
jgi:hypothetical protein